ncbi:hypothetical protein [Arthrobacter sp. NPDC092385]|uniref:MinD/ParA family ATP-binding protein n=1 Tax=Arthrobacter sp. NPDC092385 TaxID=3363943 RepID=UPI0037F3A71F
MASDPTDPSATRPGGVSTGGDRTTTATHGVPIVPGVPFLAGQLKDTEAGAVDTGDGERASGNESAAVAGEEPGHDPSEDPGTADSTDGTDGTDSTDSTDSVPGGAIALTGDAATAPNGVHLNAYAVPVSAVPPSVLQGPTLTVPAPLTPAGTPTPAGTAIPADSSVPAGESAAARATEPPGWVPSGPSASSTASAGASSGAREAAVAAEAADRAERTGRREKELGPEPASALTADRLLMGTARPPVGGWRRWLYTLTFGRVNVGDSDAVRAQRALEHRISVRLGGRTRYVPVLSRKGGVGKTTVTTLLGMALADIREDRIIAMDANPDRGTLSDRSPGRADHTARQLVKNRYTIDSFAQLADYVTRDGSRLHVLASDTDPTVAQAFDDSDYRAVTDLLSRYYSVVLTDSGTGMVHSVMKGTLDKADSVVLVSGGSVDEARLASETLSWLEAHGRQDLVARAIVVINLSSGNATQVDVSEIEQHFRSRVKTVVRIPYDRHLAEGSRIDLGKLGPATRRAATELAALVVDQLAD